MNEWDSIKSVMKEHEWPFWWTRCRDESHAKLSTSWPCGECSWETWCPWPWRKRWCFWWVFSWFNLQLFKFDYETGPRTGIGRKPVFDFISRHRTNNPFECFCVQSGILFSRNRFIPFRKIKCPGIRIFVRMGFTNWVPAVFDGCLEFRVRRDSRKVWQFDYPVRC